MCYYLLITYERKELKETSIFPIWKFHEFYVVMDFN